MTEYEIYSYEAFRRKYEDEIRIVERAEADDLNQDSLLRHELALKSERPHFARMDESHILELTSVLRNGKPTLAGIMLFSTYPQAFFPQLSIIATRIPGTQIGDTRPNEERFIDNARIEGRLTNSCAEPSPLYARIFAQQLSSLPKTAKEWMPLNIQLRPSAN